MIHLARKQNRNDFHVDVGVDGEPLPGFNIIIVECHQRSKGAFEWVVIVAETEVEITFQPPDILGTLF